MRKAFEKQVLDVTCKSLATHLEVICKSLATHLQVTCGTCPPLARRPREGGGNPRFFHFWGILIFWKFR